MSAVILAAGRGARLAGSHRRRPQVPDARSAAGTLLERQIAAIRGCGVTRRSPWSSATSASRVREVCGLCANTVDNPLYAETNSLYSLWLARAAAHRRVRRPQCATCCSTRSCCATSCRRRYEDALLVGFRGPGDRAVRRRGDEGQGPRRRGRRHREDPRPRGRGRRERRHRQVRRRGRPRCSSSAWTLLVGEGRLREWAPRAFRAFARRRPLHAIGTRGFPWIEIDFPEDYHRATATSCPSSIRTCPWRTPALALRPAGGGRGRFDRAEWRPHPGHV